MIEFVKYYIDFLRTIAENIVEFFKTFFGAFWKLFFLDVGGYFNNLSRFSNNFNFLDWIAAVVITTLNIAFVAFLFIKLFQLARKYIKFNRTEISKDKLNKEIAVLSQKLVEANDEKNKILALKMESIGLVPELASQYKGKKEPKEKYLLDSLN